MKSAARIFFLLILTMISFASGMPVVSSGIKLIQKIEKISLSRVFPTVAQPSISFPKSIIASPLLDLSQGYPLIIVPVSNGQISALNGETGKLEWQAQLPVAEGQETELISTPVIFQNKLIILYQTLKDGRRSTHNIAVFDLELKEWDANFPVLNLNAEKPAWDGKGVVKFTPPTAYSHAPIRHISMPGSDWGLLYAAFGNAGDEQPFHGWLFEIDMDAWKEYGASHAIKNVLLTTPEKDCPVSNELFGTQEMICGGGIWTPAGFQINPIQNNFELVVTTGNGQLDLPHQDYANSVLRIHPGLQFDPECDEWLCRNFDPKLPDNACLASCKNLFVPRLLNGNDPVKPANGECNDKTFTECLAWMDYDLGSSSPVKVKTKSGKEVMVQPGKEGAVYLFDAEHFGILYDRLQLTAICGSVNDPCKRSWMGMMVTKPVVSYINGEPVLIVTTFMPDDSHPAGVIALKVIEIKGKKPYLKRLWQFPASNSKKAIKMFRSHPSFPVLSVMGNGEVPIIWTVDIGNPGTLVGLNILNGALLVEQPLLGAGRQLSEPIIYKNVIYLASILPATNQAIIEAYRIKQKR
jgi:hypothetical protein